MILYSIVIFILFVYPFAKNEYAKDKGIHIWAKIINLFLSFLLFLNYVGNVKRSIIKLFEDQSYFITEVYNQIGILTPAISVFSWMLYLLMSLSIVIIFLQLPARKERLRKVLIKMLPFFWIIESIHEYKYWFMNNTGNDSEYIIPIIMFIVGVPVCILYLIYTRRFVKEFFQFNSKIFSEESKS